MAFKALPKPTSFANDLGAIGMVLVVHPALGAGVEVDASRNDILAHFAPPFHLDRLGSKKNENSP